MVGRDSSAAIVRLVLVLSGLAFSSDGFAESSSVDLNNIGLGKLYPDQVSNCEKEPSDGNRGNLGSHKGYFAIVLKSFARSVCRPPDDAAKAAMTSPDKDKEKDAVQSQGGGESSGSKGGRSPASTFISSDAAGMSTEDQTLIDDYLIVLHLGLRESSGNFQEGQDKSAPGNTGDKEEAGAFQTSYNVHGAIKDEHKVRLETLEKSYAGTTSKDCFAELADKGKGDSASVASSSGTTPDASKDVESFKTALKSCPALAVEHAAITIRHAKDHYGPLLRNEAKKLNNCQPLLSTIYNNMKNDPNLCRALEYRGALDGQTGAPRGPASTTGKTH